MKYQSTRAGVKGASFEQALFSGYAEDGGLYLPETIPKLSKDTLEEYSKLSYVELVKEIISLFVSQEELPKSDLEALVSQAYARFDTAEVVALTELQDGLNIMELWHGPTLAFKDLALSLVGPFIEYFIAKRNKHVTILVGTSGDTGSAAIESVRGMGCVDIVVLLPRGRCSRLQELQMTTVLDDNVHVYRVDGTSDDLDDPIKRVFMDGNFVKNHNLLSINSINWARIMIQIAHYFYTYFKISSNCVEVIEIVVPTGACGNITSGVIARQMGLPVQFVTAVNVNDIVARTISEGDFAPNESVKPTLAPAMDIQVPYNIERLLHLFTGGDGQQVLTLMEEIETKGHVHIPKVIHDQMKECIKSYVVEDEDITRTMVRCWENNQYLLCPHTAVAVSYMYHASGGQTKRVCLATASAAKFEEAVIHAGLTPQPTAEIQLLTSKSTSYKDMERGQDWEAMLRQTLEDITAKNAT